MLRPQTTTMQDQLVKSPVVDTSVHGGKLVWGLDGYFATVGGKILDSRARVGSLVLGHMAEVVFHRRLLGGSFSGVVKGGCLLGTGEWTCSNCGKPSC